jgi:hypothetical protein
MGKARFTARYGAGFEAEAAEVFGKAQTLSAMASSLFLAAHPALGAAPFTFVPRSPWWWTTR